MARPIAKLTIRGFKSIRALEAFEIRDLTVLIGPNGAGKSNFISFFSLLSRVVAQELQLAIAEAGGADKHLYVGPRVTRSVIGELTFGPNEYRFALRPTVDNRFVFAKNVYENHSFCRSWGVWMEPNTPATSRMSNGR